MNSAKKKSKKKSALKKLGVGIDSSLLIEYFDLSSDIDQRLQGLSSLVQWIPLEAHFDDEQISAEISYSMFDYLKRRLALEHVFLGRPLLQKRNQDSHLAAELWRLEKLKVKILGELGRLK